MSDSEDSTGDLIASASAMIIVGLLMLAAGIGCVILIGGLGSMIAESGPRGARGSATGFLTFGFLSILGIGGGGWLTFCGLRVFYRLVRGDKNRDD